MKLLFDENVSHKLVGRLSSEYPGSAHVRNVGLRGVEDDQVWSHARTGGFVIVSKAKLHRRPPAESDIQAYFQVTPPSVHNMIVSPERHGLISKTPGAPRSIRGLVEPTLLPPAGLSRTVRDVGWWAEPATPSNELRILVARNERMEPTRAGSRKRAAHS